MAQPYRWLPVPVCKESIMQLIELISQRLTFRLIYQCLLTLSMHCHFTFGKCVAVSRVLERKH